MPLSPWHIFRPFARATSSRDKQGSGSEWRRRRLPAAGGVLPLWLSGSEPSRDSREVVPMTPTPDVEAELRPRRHVVVAGAHAVNDGDPSLSTFSEHQDAPPEPKVVDLLNFYDTQVMALQKEAGDDDHAPISGNLYRYMALRPFGEASGLFQEDATPMLLAGLYGIMFIQFAAPIFIMIWVKNAVACSAQDGCISLNVWKFRQDGSTESGISIISGRILATFFIILFCMNGAFTFQREKEQMRKTLDLAAIFDAAAIYSATNERHTDYPQTGKIWMWLDPLMNIWCFLLTSINLVFILGVADGPKSIVYDAFALLFLFNLDDIGGDLAFLDDKWDEDQFGDIFGKLADQDASDDRSEGALLKDIRDAREQNFTPDNVYSLGRLMCYVLLVVLPVAYFLLDLQNATDTKAVARDEFDRLQLAVAELADKLTQK